MTMSRARTWTLLAGLILPALAISTSSSPRPAVVPARVRHVPIEEGCFVPPPELVEVPPCDDGRSHR
jgi:hypothetical protein